MKYIRLCLCAMLAVVLCSAFTLEKKEKPVYVFGVGASFKDSVVYFTEVQLLDSVALDNNGFLPGRVSYAYQMKNYLEYEKNKLDYTCAIYFSESRSKLEKEASKIYKRYEKGNTYVLENIQTSDFSFRKPEE